MLSALTTVQAEAAPSLWETIAGKILLEWLLSVSNLFTFVTVRDADAPREQRAMQILALLQRDALMAGVRPSHSGRTEAFLRLLLKAPNVADETLSTEQCKRILSQKDGRLAGDGTTTFEAAP